MIYFKSALAGFATALLMLIVSIGLFLVAPMIFGAPLGADYRTSGSGGIAVVSVGLSEMGALLILLLTLAGFVSGFWWQLKRGARTS
jgi:hypothetical protein